MITAYINKSHRFSFLRLNCLLGLQQSTSKSPFAVRNTEKKFGILPYTYPTLLSIWKCDTWNRKDVLQAWIKTNNNSFDFTLTVLRIFTQPSWMLR